MRAACRLAALAGFLLVVALALSCDALGDVAAARLPDWAGAAALIGLYLAALAALTASNR